MPVDREPLEKQLQEQAQKAIQEMLDELPEARDITLSDMETATGIMGQAIMQETLQRLVEERQPPQPSEVICADCNQKMYRRGKRKKQVVTVRGEIEVSRPYYVCPTCKAGHFPPG